MLSTPLRPLVVAALAVSVLALPIALPRPAQACGGFFCNASAPVNQAAERIIFAHGSDGMFTAVIQIQYRGPAEAFSWVLPVPGVPEVGVSSDLAFDRLVARTNPTYTLRRQVEGRCRRDPVPDLASGGSSSDGGVADSTADDADVGFEPPVVVLDHGNVGPYDYDVIGVEPTSEDPAGAAVRWLERNGYDVGALAPGILRSYLEDGMNLVAFRLSKDDSSGTVRPVTLRYADECPSIPIRPTAVAATRDMGVLVWILGESRAIPTNYFDLELNEAYINWFSPGSRYDDVVTLAADEAGGHGFVTELAAGADLLRNAIVSGSEEAAWAGFLDARADLDETALISYSAQRWGLWDGYQDALGASLVPPEGRTIAEVVQCLACTAAAPGDGGLDSGRFCSCPFDAEAAARTLDRERFLSDLEDLVVEPMRATQALFDDAAVVTRLYSTLSPAEMTVDPEFDFNPALRMVSNQHTATQVIECSPAVYEWEAPWRVELADGRYVRGSDFTWPFGSLSTMPRNVYVRDMDRAGRGRVVVDNRAAIDAVLDAHNEGLEGPDWDPADPGFAADMGPESDAPSAADVREEHAPGAVDDAALGGEQVDTSSGSAAVGSDPEPAGCQSTSGPRTGRSAAWLLGVALILARKRPSRRAQSR